MKIRCGHCRGTHPTIADVRTCGAYEDEALNEPHFCESPSCMVERGCAGYRYDSAANGFWGSHEEEEIERRGGDAWDAAMEASATGGDPYTAYNRVMAFG